MNKKKLKKILVIVNLFFLIISTIFPIFSSPFKPKIVTAASNTCGGINSISNSPKVGGVALNQAATFLADMTEYTGAYYDDENDRIVFIGRTNTSSPQFNKDDLAVAIRTLFFENRIPAVSLEPSSDPNYMDVVFTGNLADTKFGQILLDADWMLKQYMHGFDENDNPISSSVPTYKSVLDRYIDLGPGTTGNSSRWWIVPDLVSLKKDDTTESFVFDEVNMEVLTEPTSPSNLPNWNQAAEDFAGDLTQYYDDYADEVPEFYEIKQLAKVVAVAKWILDNGIATDMSWAKDYEPTYHTTPRQMPKLTTPNVDGGNGYSYFMSGGVQYDTSNTYNSDDGTAADLKSASEAVDAPKEQIHWTFIESSVEYDAVAVEASAFRSLGSYSTAVTDMAFPIEGDLNLSFTRSYSSFSGGQRGIGRGWSFMPSVVSDNYPVVGGIAVTTCNGTTFKHRYKLSFEPADGGERESFTYDCDIGGGSYIPDQQQFHSDIIASSTSSAQVLYEVKKKNQMRYLFEDRFEDPTETTRVNLKLLQIIDKNGNKIFYNYESTQSAKLISISDEHNHIITLNYASESANLISSITDWDNRTVNYTYDGQGNLITVTDPRGNVTTYTYDSNNKLISIEDREEDTIIQNSYTPEAKLLVSTDSAGLTKSFAYDETNRIIYATDSASIPRTTKIKYDEKARILEDIDALNNKITYTYATESAPLTIRDKNNNLTTNTYDTNGNLTSVTFPDAKVVAYEYDSGNRVTKITDGRYGGSPKLTTFGYDSFGNLRYATESGKTTSFTYNSAGEMLTKTNPLNNVTTWTRDNFGNQLTEVNPLNKTTLFEYDTLGRLKKQTDPNSKSLFFTYDNNNNILTSSNSAGTTTYEYDKENRPKKTILPNSTETDFSYNSSGSLTSVTDELNNVTEYNYDNHQNLIARQDALDRTTLYQFDMINQATQSATPLGKVIKWEHDANGNITKRVDENNQETDYTYNNMHRLTNITYPDTSEVDFTYDDRGNLTLSESDVTNTTYTYDAFDRLTSISNSFSGTTSYQYDNDDNLVELTYPNNETVYYEYDDNNRLIEFTDWNDKITTFTYNDNGTLETRTLPNDVETNYTFDPSNRLIGVRHEQNGVDLAEFTYTRDSLGNIVTASESSGLIIPVNPENGFSAEYFDNKTLSGSPSVTRTDPDVNFHWRGSPAPGISANEFSVRWTGDIEFDDGQYSFTTSTDDGVKLYIDNQLVINQWLDQAETPYTYIASMSAGLHEIKMEYYDNQDYAVAELLVSKVAPTSSQFTAQYWNNTDLSGSPTVTRNENGPVNYVWGQGVSSPHGSIDDTTWSARWTKTEYFEAGTYHFATSTDDGVRLKIDGNLEYEHEFSGSHYVNKYLSEGNHTIVMEYYQWDGPAYAQLSYEPIDPISTPKTTIFTYDLLGRLIGGEYPNQRNYEYTYDKVGNITVSTSSGQLSLITYNNDNQLTNKDGRTFAYDNRGNMTDDGIKEYEYDFDNRLLGVFDDEAGLDVEYQYDGDGNRVGKSINETPTLQYATDVSGEISRLLGVNDLTNSTQTYYFYGMGPIAQGPDDDSYRQYYLEDGLGNVRYLVDNTGSNIQPFNFDPYGNQILGSTVSDFQYKGEYTDESEIYYLRARYYHPEISRFVSQDPVEGYLTMPHTQNGYNFVSNNPINLSDPSGRDAYGFCSCGSAGVGASGSFSSCNITTPNGSGRVHSTTTGANTFDIIGLGKSFYYNWDDNIKNPSDLNGTSSVLGFWVGPLDVSFEKNTQTNKITAVEVQFGVGISTPIGIHGGKNVTTGPNTSW